MPLRLCFPSSHLSVPPASLPEQLSQDNVCLRNQTRQRVHRWVGLGRHGPKTWLVTFHLEPAALVL